MKSLISVLAFVGIATLAACGNNDSSPQPAPTPAPVVQNSAITSNWVNSDSTSRIPALNLSAIVAGSPVDVAPLVDCVALLNGAPDESGNSPAINGVGLNQVQVTDNGDGTGSIQFGPLSHADHNLNDVCYTLGQELYNYTITGSSMTIVDPAYPQFPSTFTAQ